MMLIAYWDSLVCAPTRYDVSFGAKMNKDACLSGHSLHIDIASTLRQGTTHAAYLKAERSSYPFPE